MILLWPAQTSLVARYPPGAGMAAFTPNTDGYARKVQRMSQAVRTLLEGIGEDVDRQGLLDTPKVVVDSALGTPNR